MSAEKFDASGIPVEEGPYTPEVVEALNEADEAIAGLQDMGIIKNTEEQ